MRFPLGSRLALRLALVALALLVIILAPSLREALVSPLVRHAQALGEGRPLKGFPDSHLHAYAASLAKQELEARAAMLGELRDADRQVLERRLKRVRFQAAQVRQELLWVSITMHPLRSAGVAILVLAGLYGLGRLRSGRRAPPLKASGARQPESGPRVQPEPRPLEIPDELSLESRSSSPAGPPGSKEARPQDRAPGTVILEDAPEIEVEVEALLKGLDPIPEPSGDSPGQEPSGDSPGREPSGASPGQEPALEGWARIARERVPPLEMAHLIDLFVSDSSRSHLGLLGFLSHQAALANAQSIRILSGRRGVQIFLSTSDREQELGELPPGHFARLVSAVRSMVPETGQSGPGLEPPRLRWLVPSENGYQLQELTLAGDAIELKALDHVRFLPAGW